MVYVAIDPGASGAIALHDADGRVAVETMPGTLRDILELLEDWRAQGPGKAIIEKVGTYMPGNSGPAACTFARHCGALEMALIAAGYSWTDVTPQKWQKHYGSLPKEKAERKRALKEIAQRLYPDIKVTLVNADALLLLRYLTNTERAT